MVLRGVMVGLLVEGLALCAVGAVVASNGFPFVVGVLVFGGGLAALLEGVE
jgi:hypothetical protein